MNTDQAFDLLMEAGVTEDTSIQTVRRWLRERKINYEGTGQRDSGYIIDNSDQVFNMLKDAGVTDSIAFQIVRRLLREGKIQTVGTGNRKTNNQQNEIDSKQFIISPSDQEKVVHQLKIRIKAQDEHIKGIEHLHKTSVTNLIKQRDILHKEIASLKNEKSELQKETKKLLKENIDLTNELLKLKEELFKGNKRGTDKTHDVPPSSPNTNDYRQKLGLSKMASDKEVLTRYKQLLKITHPDHGGNATAFHFIKTDYDYFRKSIKLK